VGERRKHTGNRLRLGTASERLGMGLPSNAVVMERSTLQLITVCNCRRGGQKSGKGSAAEKLSVTKYSDHSFVGQDTDSRASRSGFWGVRTSRREDILVGGGEEKEGEWTRVQLQTSNWILCLFTRSRTGANLQVTKKGMAPQQSE